MVKVSINEYFQYLSSLGKAKMADKSYWQSLVQVGPCSEEDDFPFIPGSTVDALTVIE